MPSGCFGTAQPAANVKTTIYTVPAGKVATANINVANASDTPATVHLYVGPAPAQGAEWPVRYCIEPGVTLPARGVLKQTGIAIGAGESVAILTTGNSIGVRVDGYEQEA
ncbi:MAG: hypothetical protein WBB32_12915 [Flavobacteriales bacterium]|uniref:Uncharacterized protein n=1 Tax=Stenotrophomonas acidaminiphila TaxID=128780 RepID=A0A0S1B3S2_9GAMM|nr:hypothetical protein [Stenotrophomonas acidaminiphila]ALJ29736.1 hypothetical protein AOT14_33960 [Stenotrophomonas acidaminiphila]